MQATKQARAFATRERILREATRLFTLKGYHDTKLEEVQRVAKVTTGAFFHHFRGKEDLAFASMDWYGELRRHELSLIDQALRQPSDDPLAEVFRWLDATQERFRRRFEDREAGCIYGNLSTALCDTHEVFRQRLAESFDRMAQDYQTRLDAAARQRGLDSLDTFALARYIIAVLEGSIMLARAHQDARCLARHFQLLKQHLRLIFQANPGEPSVGSSRVDLQACKLEYSIVSPK